jgi:translation initiation factor IF-3
VCKIIDFGKYKYWKKKKAHEAKKHQTVIHVKEVKFRPRIDIHDYGVKLKRIREFLGEGNKVKATVMFRGREMAYRDQGRELLEKVAKDVVDIGKIDDPPKPEGRIMIMVLSAIK